MSKNRKNHLVEPDFDYSYKWVRKGLGMAFLRVIEERRRFVISCNCSKHGREPLVYIDKPATMKEAQAIADMRYTHE